MNSSRKRATADSTEIRRSHTRARGFIGFTPSEGWGLYAIARIRELRTVPPSKTPRDC